MCKQQYVDVCSQSVRVYTTTAFFITRVRVFDLRKHLFVRWLSWSSHAVVVRSLLILLSVLVVDSTTIIIYDSPSLSIHDVAAVVPTQRLFRASSPFFPQLFAISSARCAPQRYSVTGFLPISKEDM